LKIEPQPTMRTTEANRPQVIGVSVDPLAINAESLGNNRRVNETHRAQVCYSQQFRNSACDCLDCLGIDL